MNYRRLLAKSVRGGRSPDSPNVEETLPGHLRIVGETAAEIVGSRADHMLRNVGLDPGIWAARLSSAVIRAAVLHDIGKASLHFQQMVRRLRRQPQALRHEVVGLWMVAVFPAFAEWLFQNTDDTVRYAVLRAIVGHHLKFDRAAAEGRSDAMATDLPVFAGHRDVSRSLEIAAVLLQLPPPPPLPDAVIDLLDGCPPALADLLDDAQRWWNDADSEARRFASVVAALVVGSDVAGSAIARQQVNPASWARTALSTRCTGDDLRAASDARLRGRPRRPFQDQVADSPSRLTLALAGCGSGKTVAAYDWAASRARGRKLFFCYPTTGTASEGFQDYAYPEFGDDSALVHSRADLDLERILDNGADDADDPDSARPSGSPSILTAVKEQGLRLWQAPMIVCTADAVLGLVQHNRVGLFGSPAILDAAFVFDEIHLYDPWMFGTLLAFLEAFRCAPVLLMTATLQSGRLAALRDLAARLGESMTELGGPAELEDLKRYTLAGVTSSVAFDRAVAQVRDGDRVLWVANTVDRAVCIGQAAEALGLRVEPYHSRFRYEDRLNHHRTVVDLFKPERTGPGALAVTTQVCEVSLDISADLLVTELAPPPSLIQRLGRLNRWATPKDNPTPLPALVVEPESPLPYGDEDLGLGRAWLAALPDGPLSQRQLADAFNSVLADDPIATRSESAWLDNGWVFRPAPVRSGGVTFSVVRQEDVDPVEAAGLRFDGVQVTRNTIPMLWSPVAREAPGWRRYGLALRAPVDRISYSPRWGATWQ